MAHRGDMFRSAAGGAVLAMAGDMILTKTKKRSILTRHDCTTLVHLLELRIDELEQMGTDSAHHTARQHNRLREKIQREQLFIERQQAVSNGR